MVALAVRYISTRVALQLLAARTSRGVSGSRQDKTSRVVRGGLAKLLVIANPAVASTRQRTEVTPAVVIDDNDCLSGGDCFCG